MSRRAPVAAAVALALALGPAFGGSPTVTAPRPAVPVAAAAPGATAGEAAEIRLDRDGFRLAVPPYAFQFPFDHAAHPAFRSEWWYYTGHLRARDRRFGYELTFFRIAVPASGGHGSASGGSAWRARQVLFRHLALTDETGKRFRFDDRAERQALDLAGADSTRFLVWVGDDYAGLEGDRTTHRLVGHAQDFALDLRLTPERPPVVHGRDGVSQKSAGEGRASHYYSFTRMATRGRLELGDDTLAVEGLTWMDHEFGSANLSNTHTGWDWFSVQLSDGSDLMLYRMRTVDGRLDTCSSGTIVEPDGRSRSLTFRDFASRSAGEWVSPRTGGRYPGGWWDVRVPGDSLQLRLTPTLEDQELVAASMGGIAYWEGSVQVSGKRAGKEVSGQGYVELTGYVGPSPFQTARLDSLRRVR
jgi:predicted secreted hydrolase